MPQDSLEHFLTQFTDTDEYNTLQQLLRGELTAFPHFPLRQLLVHFPSYITSIKKLNPLKYRYSLEVEAFADCVAAYSFPDVYLLETVCKYPAVAHIYCAELEHTRMHLSHCLHDLHQRLQSATFKHKASQQQSRMNRNYRTMCHYVDTLFTLHARPVVVRVDFSYISTAQIEIEQLEQHLERFYESTLAVYPVHQHPLGLFSHLKGRILKIEYGVEKGLHVHALLFFDGSKRKGSSDVHLAQSIGEYWRDKIVGAEGHYWNCNDKKYHYERLGRLGIGEIHALEQDKMNNLKNIVRYFCKRKQYIKPISKPKMRLVRAGDLPDIPLVKKGAPRKELPNIISKRIKKLEGLM